jgi:N-acetylmuramoyl-L-alanine amidase
MTRTATLVAVLSLVVVAGCGDSPSSGDSPSKDSEPRLGLPETGTTETTRTTDKPPTRSPPESARRPPIRQWRIPFGQRRREETAAYAERHYGVATSKLNPKVIVEHVSLTPTARATYDTFAPNRKDPELHELPGVCSHFVVDREGTIYQLVSLDLICRHTVGLNDHAFGIEHIGSTDADVLGNSAQMRASLRLTNWLRCRFGTEIRNVIGHNESLSSPYHHERVASLRTQTHSDWRPASMEQYRARLREVSC